MPIVLSSPGTSFTYAQLRADVADWLHRSDLTASIPTFVRLAESDIRNDVRVQAQETEAVGVVSGGSIAHPVRMLEARRLTLDDIPFSYVSPERFSKYQRFGSVGYVYTSIGRAFKVTTGTNYRLVYDEAFPELVADTDTNWLLQNAYDVYLNAALKHAAIWTGDDENATKFGTLYQSSVARINDREASAWFSGGPLQMIPAVTE